MVTVSDQRVTVYNRTDRPQHTDSDGRLLDGLAFGSVKRTERVDLGISRGDFLVIDDPGGDLTGMRQDAADAIRATRKANGRRKPAADSEPSEPTNVDGNKGA